MVDKSTEKSKPGEANAHQEEGGKEGGAVNASIAFILQTSCVHRSVFCVPVMGFAGASFRLNAISK